MAKEHGFARGETAPSWWANALQEFVSTLGTNLRLELANATTLRAPAGAGDAQVAIGVQGRWRFNTAAITAVVSGGAGARDVFVTAKETSIVSAPDPFTDATDRTFALAVVAAGASPAIVAGSVDLFRKVATVGWDGSSVTSIAMLVGPDSGAGLAGGDLYGAFPSPEVQGEVGARSDTVWSDNARLSRGFWLPAAGEGQRFRRRYIRNLTVDASARRLGLFTVSRSTVDWQSTAPVEIVVKTVGQGNGGITRSIVRGGYDDPARIDVLEVAGNRPYVPVMGVATASNGNLREDYVYLDLPQYARVLVQVTYNHSDTGFAAGAAAGFGQIAFDGVAEIVFGSGASVWTGERVQKHASQHAAGGTDPLPVVVRGMVNANGTKAGGAGWSVARTVAGSVGRYTITYDTPFATVATPVVSQGQGNALAQWHSAAAGSFKVECFGGDGLWADGAFSFTAAP